MIDIYYVEDDENIFRTVREITEESRCFTAGRCGDMRQGVQSGKDSRQATDLSAVFAYNKPSKVS